MSEGNGYATKAQIFEKFAGARYADKEIMGMKVRLKSWTARKAAEFARQNKKRTATANERLITQVVVDSEDRPVFTDSDIRQLKDLDAKFIASLATACLEHVGLNADEEEAIEEEEKN